MNKFFFTNLSKKRKQLFEALRDPAVIGILEFIIGKYSDQAHFVYELLQNADDAGATCAEFILFDSELIFKHNGTKKFTISNPDMEMEDTTNGALGDINAITSIGNSNKRNNKVGNKIGKFGIGFKSIFRYTFTPEIYEPNVAFRIENLIVPVLLNENPVQSDSDETIFRIPFNIPPNNQFNIPPCSSDKAFKDISKKLRGLDCPIMFLSHLQEVRFNIKGQCGVYKREIIEQKSIGNIRSELVTMNQPSNTLQFRLFTREHEGKNYSVAYLLNDNNRLVPIEKTAFCFFPTKHATNLHFVIHAPFLLTPNRERILSDNEHNQKMIKLLAKLAADSLICLRDMNLIDDKILEIIPLKKFYYGDDEISFTPFFNTIKDTMQKEKILPARNGYVTRRNAYWANTIELTKIFSDEQLGAIVNNPEAAWVFRSIRRDESEINLRNYVDELTSNNLDDRSIINGRNDFYSKSFGKTIQGIDKNFIEAQSIEWLQSFYRWLAKTLDRIDIAKVKPFFWDTEKNAVPAFDENGTLILFLPSDSDYTTIHPELLANFEIADFLKKKIGIKEPSLKDEIYNKILPQYKDHIVPHDKFDERYFKKIFSYYKDCPSSESGKYIDDLKELLYFRTIDQKYSVPEILYNPKPALKKYFHAANITADFLDENFYCGLVNKTDAELLQKFFKDLGIVDEVRYVSRRFSESDAKNFSTLGFKLPFPHATMGTARIWSESLISGSEELLKLIVDNNDEEKSFLLWERLLAVNNNVGKLKSNLVGQCNYKFHGDNTQRYTPTVNMQKFMISAWLVDKNGVFKKPTEITVDEMAKRYEVNTDNGREVINFFGILERKPEDNRLTAEEKKLIDQAKKLSDAGFTDDDIEKLISDKIKSMTPPKSPSTPLQKLSAKKIEPFEKNSDETSGDTRKNISYSTFPAEPTAKIIDEEREVDSDDLTPAPVNYSKKLELAQHKLDIEQQEIAQLEELQKKVSDFEKYSFGWCKALLDLEILNSHEKNSNGKEISISFNRVEFDVKTQRTLLLKYPSHYIPQFMEELENIQLVLHTATTTKTVEIEVAAVSNYTLRVKLKDNSKLDDINLSDVTEATINAKNPVFLLEELKKQFDGLDFNDDFNLRDNLCKNIDFVFGPPGTGKTHNLAKKILRLMDDPSNKKILVLTPTNKAADVLVNKIVELDDKKNYRDWLLRFGTTKDDNIEKLGIFRDKTFDINSVTQNVTVTTIARFSYDFFITDGKRIYLRGINWDNIIIDEASMIPLAQILLPLYMKTPKKFIIAGDPFQIEPVTAVDLWRGENIYTLVELKSFTAPRTIPHEYKVECLTTQYRSVPAIGKIFSNFTYGGILKHNRVDADRLPLNIDDWLDVRTLNIIKFPVSNYESIYRARRLNGTSSYQVYSALLTFEFVNELSNRLEKNNPNEKFSIGIIAPYHAQADLIEKLFASKKRSKAVDIQVGTVHTFQGDECNILFAVLNAPPTISSSAKMFLNRQNIINVAISRARDYLFLVMPDDNTYKVENLHLIKRVEKLFANETNSGEFVAQDIETLLFGTANYIEENSFTTGHQNVNVYVRPERNYEIRSEDTAVDIQLHGN